MEEEISIHPLLVSSDVNPIVLWINASYNNNYKSSTNHDEFDSSEWQNERNVTNLLVGINKNWTSSSAAANSFIVFNLKAIKWLNFYYLCAIMIVGVLGNGFNFIAFLRTRRKLSSPSYYLATLALADAVFLAIIFIVWISHFKIKLFFWSGVYKILVYLSSLSSCMSRKSSVHFISRILSILFFVKH